MEQLRQIKTVTLAAHEPPTHGIMVALQLAETDRASEWAPALAEQFVLQRMVSPPDTSLLLVTIIGAFDAGSFLAAWRGTVEADPVLALFLAQMRLASYVHGTMTGERLSEGSLHVAR